MGQADGGRPAGIEVLDRMIQQRLEIIEIAKSLQWAQSAVGKPGKPQVFERVPAFFYHFCRSRVP